MTEHCIQGKVIIKERIVIVQHALYRIVDGCLITVGDETYTLTIWMGREVVCIVIKCEDISIDSILESDLIFPELEGSIVASDESVILDV